MIKYKYSLQIGQIDKHMVSGKISNTGQSLVFRVEDGQVKNIL